MFHQCSATELEPRGAVVLTQLVVDPQPNAQIRRRANLVYGQQRRPHGAVGVKGFRQTELTGGPLPVAHAQVVDAHEAGDDLPGLFRLDMAATLADDDGEFRLVIQLPGHPGQMHIIIRADDAGGGLGEHHRDLGDGDAQGLGLFDMLQVVKADGEDLARTRHRRQQADASEGDPWRRRQGGPGAGEKGLPGFQGRDHVQPREVFVDA